MFYLKNLPGWERVLRAVFGLGLAFLGLYAGKGMLITTLLAGSGVGIALTGFIGFCPMCAMVGRKLRKAES